MKFFLKQMSIRNFKGIRDLVIDFGHSTDILGRNASGKSTVFDAFTWCLFGKDSHDNVAFEIKPLDENGTALSQVDNEVELILIVTDELGNKKTNIVRHIHREKWSKKRGSEVAEFVGNTHDYFWNDVPLQAGEFKQKVEGLIPESLFKLITNPHYFNGMKWQDRRKTLMAIGGDISAQEVINSISNTKPEYFTLLIEALNSDKSIAELRAQLAANKKKLRDELERIPIRIDELARNTPEPLQWDVLQAGIDAKKQRISDIDNALTDAAQAEKEIGNKRLALQKEVNELEFEIQRRQNQIKDDFFAARNKRLDELKDVGRRLTEARRNKNIKATEAAQNALNIDGFNEKMDALRARYEAEANKNIEFDAHEFTCPTCLRALEPGDIDAKKAKLLENFNQEKTRTLEKINSEGLYWKEAKERLVALNKKYHEGIELLNNESEQLDQELQRLHGCHESLLAKEEADIADALIADMVLKDLKLKLASKTDNLNAPKSIAEDSRADLKAEKVGLLSEVNQLAIEFNKKDQIEQAGIRRKELEESQRKLAGQLAAIEKAEYGVLQFEQAEVDLLEDRINVKFKFARFKMFNKLVNGGMEPCCDTTYDGVPYNDLNTAAKMLVGIDIINVLCDHYKVSAPIFLDNRESVTTVPKTKSQIINLIVSPNDPELRVSTSNAVQAETA
ncbi:MAG: AAA family ATPase [Bacteroidetes bacterium]|nr:AAA family ATPase [Bacteroidota bacterium]